MALPTTSSISQVSRESKRLELRGSVQTVFPIRACAHASALADSETQDVSWAIGTDGPLEGRGKASVFYCPYCTVLYSISYTGYRNLLCVLPAVWPFVRPF